MRSPIGKVAGGSAGRGPLDAKVVRDLRTLVRFVEHYCAAKHGDRERRCAEIRSHDVAALCGAAPRLCADCAKLLTHALVKRTHCPMDPKPACRLCPKHCYASRYREEIRRVMRYVGPRALLLGWKLG